MTDKYNADLVRQLYQPTLESMSKGYMEMGDSLQAVCAAVADDMAVQTVNKALTALKITETSLKRLRVRLMDEQ